MVRLTVSLSCPTCSGESGWGVRTTSQATVAPSRRARVTVTKRVPGIFWTSEGPDIRRFEHFLYLLDFVNDAFNVHSVSISDMSVAFVKRGGSAAFPQ